MRRRVPGRRAARGVNRKNKADPLGSAFINCKYPLRRIIITLIFLSAFTNIVYASDNPIKPQDPSDSLFVMFVTAACTPCISAETFTDTLSAQYPLDSGGFTKVDKRIIDISVQDGAAAAQRFFEAYGVPQGDRHTPILFYTSGYMVGDNVIKQNLEMLIRSGALQNFQEPQVKPDVSLSFPLIFGAGLIGGVNPCSVSMVLLLLSLLASRRDQIVHAGISYMIGKLITYLFLGLVLFKALQALNSGAFRVVAGAAKWVAVLLAAGLFALNIADFFNARREKYGNIRVQLPGRLRAFNNGLIKKTAACGAHFLIPLVFILGVIVSAGEFLCTGQVYLAAILYVLRSGGNAAVPAFLTYVTAMIIPMGILVFLCAKGKRVLEMSEFARKNLPAIKLANAVLFLAFAVYMIEAK